MTNTVTVSDNGICPECEGILVIRGGGHGPFFGCSHFPDCQYTRPLKTPSNGHIVKVLEGQQCPKCHFSLVVRQGRFGMFIGCSQYPQCNHKEVIDKPDETSISCPQCGQGRLLQRTSRFGKVFHACNRYPDCQFTFYQQPIVGECVYCHYPLLIEKRTAQGIKYFCASKLCGKTVVFEQ